MVNSKDNFYWADYFGSICNSALIPKTLADFDSGHAAHQFNEYWNKLADGNMPCHSQFSPAEVKQCLKWLMVFKETPLDNGMDFQLTLIGTSAEEMAVHAKKGQFLKEFTEDECYSSRKQVMVNAISTGRPSFARIDLASKGEYKTNVLTGIFPFKDKEGHKVFSLPCPENKRLRSLM
jgi:hypothetical protein